MNKIKNWVYKNKVFSLVLLILAFFLFNQLNLTELTSVDSLSNTISNKTSRGSSYYAADGDYAVSESASIAPSQPYPLPPIDENISPTQTADRMVIRNADMSILVDDVSVSINQIQEEAESVGGYRVNSYTNNPESASNGSISLRVPQEKLDEVLNSIRDIAVRVTNETISGKDITDQYQDLEKREEILLQTQAKFQAIFDQAEEVEDLLNVQRELLQVQRQLDAIEGQKQYLSQSSKLSLVTVYLSTDELALDYTPSEVWRPKVVYKQAVRSLIRSFRQVANTGIWFGVYAVIWVPLAFISYFGYKFLRKKK